MFQQKNTEESESLRPNYFRSERILNNIKSHQQNEKVCNQNPDQSICVV